MINLLIFGNFKGGYHIVTAFTPDLVQKMKNEYKMVDLHPGRETQWFTRDYNNYPVINRTSKSSFWCLEEKISNFLLRLIKGPQWDLVNIFCFI